MFIGRGMGWVGIECERGREVEMIVGVGGVIELKEGTDWVTGEREKLDEGECEMESLAREGMVETKLGILVGGGEWSSLRYTDTPNAGRGDHFKVGGDKDMGGDW